MLLAQAGAAAHAAAAAGHELIILIGALVGAVLFGRFAWRQFDNQATPGQRAGALAILVGLLGVVVIVAVAVTSSSSS